MSNNSLGKPYKKPILTMCPMCGRGTYYNIRDTYPAITLEQTYNGDQMRIFNVETYLCKHHYDEITAEKDQSTTTNEDYSSLNNVLKKTLLGRR